MVFNIVALLVAVVALVYAFMTQRKLNDLTQRLSRSSNNVYQLSSQVEELSQQVETQSKELRFELK